MENIIRTAQAVIAGARCQRTLCCLRAKCSGKHVVRRSPCERHQAFFDAHLHAFELFGGMFPILMYDHLTSAVRKVLRGRHREDQASFVTFRASHNVEARCCTPGQGHEKGGVEGLVGYARCHDLVPVPEATSLAWQFWFGCFRSGFWVLSVLLPAVKGGFQQLIWSVI
ncbi:MAG: transposase [bacterium]|nr:transposase [bacterium]